MEISEDKLYTDEQGNEYIERGLLDDKRVYRDSEDNRYIEHSIPVRIFSGAFGLFVISVFCGLLFFEPVDVEGYGRYAGIVEFLGGTTLGNIIAGIISLILGGSMLIYAYTGREMVEIE